MAFVYTGEDFVKEHSTEGPGIVIEEHLAFPSGATAARDLTMLYSPPEDDFKRLKLQRAYWQELVRRVTQDFTRIKAALRGTSKEGPVHSSSLNTKNLPEGTDALIHLKMMANKYQKKIRAIDADLTRTPQMQAKAKQAESQEEAERLAQREHLRLNKVLDSITLNDDDRPSISEETLRAMPAKELQAFAQESNIDLQGKTAKAEVLEIIIANLE